MVCELGFLWIRQTPSSLIVCFSPELWPSVSVNKLYNKELQLTFEESAGEVDAHVRIPGLDAALCGSNRDRLRLNLLNLSENPLLRTEADDDLRHTEEERLDPKFHELTLEILHGSIITDLDAGLELHPVGRRTLLYGLGIPDYVSMFSSVLRMVC